MLGIGDGPVVGYLGALYGPKRVPFLLDALAGLRERVPSVEVIIIGSGREAELVTQFASTNPWVHPVGAQYGLERVRYGLVCDALLMPGLVGLNVVDGFALGLPTITTDIDYHSPEIAYLQHGENGWIVPADATPGEFAAQTAELLEDRGKLAQLQQAAFASGSALGVEPMAERFAAGVRLALDAPRRRRTEHQRTSA